jgi:hypothetical protein
MAEKGTPAIANAPQLEGSPRKFISPTVYSALTGLSMATVRRRLSTKQIPSLQPGGRRSRVLIPLDALQASAEEAGSVQAAKGSSGPLTTGEPKSAIEQQIHLPGPRPRWMI